MTLTPLRFQFVKYAVTHCFWSPNNLSTSAFEEEPRLNVSQCKQHIHENRMCVYMFMHTCYCRFQVTFQHAVPKFVANLPITLPSSELRNKVRKYISMFELRLLTNVHAQ
jgi:hypothetical protein